MLYYDIHTHKITSSDNALSVYNLTTEDIDNGLLHKKEYGCYFSTGIHPWQSGESQIDMEMLEDVLSDKNIVALGEVGLDKACNVPFERQTNIFTKQIGLAVKYDLPLIIHCVKAWDELIAFRKKIKHEKPWIIHGFRGGKEQLKQLSKFNFLFSFGEYYNKEALFAAFPDRILIETDESNLNIKEIYNKIQLDLACNMIDLQNVIKQNVSCVVRF